MMFKVVLFDLGDTLIKNVKIDLKKGLNCLLKDKNINEQENQEILYYVYQLLINRDKEEYPALKIIEDLNNKYNLGIKNYNEAEYQLLLDSETSHLNDNVKDVLDYLEEKNIVMGVVSNSIFSSDALSKALEKYNIRSYFKFVVASADVLVRKPYSEIFEYAFNKLKDVKKEEVIFIGDNYKIDYEGSIAYGFQSIQIDELGFKEVLRKLKIGLNDE